MIPKFPQITPSDFCLSCRGCCIFREPDTSWGPNATPDELRALAVSAAAGEMLTRDGRRLATCPEGSRHRCCLLQMPGHLCRAYADRPFECRFYPFLLSAEKGELRVYAHLSCPYVQENIHSRMWTEHVEQLRALLTTPDAVRALRRNSAFFPDYSPYSDQIEPVFDVPCATPADLLAARAKIERQLSLRSRSVSALSFVNLFAWQDFFDYTLEEVDGHLCVFASQPVGTFLYWPPLGESLSPRAVDHCFARMRAMNRGRNLTRIENVPKEDLAAFDPARFTVREQGLEYCYRTKDIADLAGNAYKSKRHDVNLFCKTFRHEYRPFEEADLAGCLELLDQWLDKRGARYDDDIYRHMLRENRAVHELLMRHAQQLGLTGRVVLVEGRVAAYTFGYPLNDDVFCDLLEVADHGRKGVGTFIFQQFARDEAVRPFALINAMDDFGMPNIARTKRSYRPSVLEPVFAVTETAV